MKQNFSAFLHQNKRFFVASALAILSIIPLKSFSNELNKASAATKAITEVAIVSYAQNISSPDSAQVWYKKGDTAYENEQYNEAIKYLEKAIELDPNHVKAYYMLGWAYLNGEQNGDKAIECFNKQIKLNPNDATAYNALGLVYAHENGDYADAIKYFNKAIELDPNAAYAYYNLGSVYLIQNNENKVIEFYKKAASLGDGNAQYWLRENNIEW